MLIDLHRFLSHEAHKYIFYGWIRNFRINFPDVPLDKAIQNFMKHHQAYNDILNPDNFNAESARVTYYNMDKQFTEMQKKK
jgi:hypothetical protein